MDMLNVFQLIFPLPLHSSWPRHSPSFPHTVVFKRLLLYLISNPLIHSRLFCSPAEPLSTPVWAFSTTKSLQFMPGKKQRSIWNIMCVNSLFQDITMDADGWICVVTHESFIAYNSVNVRWQCFTSLHRPMCPHVVSCIASPPGRLNPVVQAATTASP